MADYSAEHVGKRVVAQDGGEVGSVADVRDGDLYVEVSADADAEVLDHLGWSGPVSQETHRLDDEYVSNVREDVVRLRV